MCLFLLGVNVVGPACCVGNPRALPPPLGSRRRTVLLGQGSGGSGSVLVIRGLQLIICVTHGFSARGAGVRSLVSVNAVKLVGTMGAFYTSEGVGLTACTSHYVRGRVLVCLEGGSSRGGRVSVSRPLGVS